MSETLTVVIHEGEHQTPEAQEVLKAIHKLQRKQYGLEIKRGTSGATEGAPPSGDPAPKKKTAGKSSKGGAAAKKLKADDVREAYISVLSQFESKTERSEAKATGERILSAHGAAKLSALKPSKYTAFVEDCENYDRGDADNPYNQSETDDDVDGMID